MSKNIVFNIEARDGLKRGVDALANAVKVTLGPRGRNVTIGNIFGAPQVTKDGVTVAKEIELEDALENMGAQMVKEVASKTNDLAGDGTTTATVLAQAIVKEGLKNVAAGANPMDLKRGIDKAVFVIVSSLNSQSKIISNSSDEIKQVASVSSNNDEFIGGLIAEAYTKVGNNGSITSEESNMEETYIDIVEGMKFDRGYLSPHFITNKDKMLVELENPYVLIMDKKISNLQEILPILEPVASTNRALVVIAEDVDGKALKTMVLNKLKADFEIVAVKAPFFGDNRTEFLEDIAVLTKGQVISNAKGHNVSNINMELVGAAKKVVISSSSTTIINGYGDKEDIEKRIQQLMSAISNSKSKSDILNLKGRVSKLSGGVAIMYVGATTDIEMREKKDRVDDALNATRAAIEEGIVPGGGVALLRAKDKLSEIKVENQDEQTGVNIIIKAIEAPIRVIVDNAGGEGSVVVAKVMEGKKDFGYDAKNERYGSMFDWGIIDPKKVTRIALENAASVAGMILTTECALIERDSESILNDMMSQPERSMI